MEGIFTYGTPKVVAKIISDFNIDPNKRENVILKDFNNYCFNFL